MAVSHRSVRTATAVGVVTGLVITATADFTTSRYTSGSDFELVMSNMPDLDQRRAGLPSNDATSDVASMPGGHFCLPTATSNLFAYTAIHGYPDCAPGLDTWNTNTGDYATGTDFIARVGTAMETRGQGGTDPGPAFRGARRIKDAELGSRFIVTTEVRSRTNVVTLRELALHAVRHHEVQMIRYGNYEKIGVNAFGFDVMDRQGGHAMTLIGARRNGIEREISYHNPGGNDTNYDTQSPVDARTNAAPWHTNLVVADSIAESFFLWPQGMNEIRPSNDGRLRMLDMRIGLRPACGHSWGDFDNGSSVSVGSIDLAFGANADGEDRSYGFASLPSAMIGDGRLAISPNGMSVFLDRTLPGGRLLIESPANPDTMVEVPVDGLNLPPIDDIVFSTDHTLVLQCGRRMIGLSGLASGLPADEDAPVRVAWESQVPFPIGRMVSLGWGEGFNGGGDQDLNEPLRTRHPVLAISRDGTSAAECWSTQEGDPIVKMLPVELDLGDGRIEDTWAQVDSLGTIWFLTSGESRVRALLGDGTVIQQELGVHDARGLAVDDLDQLLIPDGGVVRCFRPDEGVLLEVGPESSPFAGEVVGRDFTLDRSSTNADLDQHTAARGWYDVVEESACPGDFNGDHLVDGADFGTLLGSWGVCHDCPADLNHDGLVDGADMGLLLGLWGDCDPQP